MANRNNDQRSSGSRPNRNPVYNQAVHNAAQAAHNAAQAAQDAAQNASKKARETEEPLCSCPRFMGAKKTPVGGPQKEESKQDAAAHRSRCKKCGRYKRRFGEPDNGGSGKDTGGKDGKGGGPGNAGAGGGQAQAMTAG